MSDRKEQLEEKSRNAILKDAVWQVENALVLAGSMIGTAALYIFPLDIPVVPDWTLLVAGVGLSGFLTWSTLTDKKSNAKVVEKILMAQYDTTKIHSTEIRRKVDEAIAYRAKMAEKLDRARDSGLTAQLAPIVTRFEDWLEEIYLLALRVDKYQLQRPQQQRVYKRAKARKTKLIEKKNREKNPVMLKDLETSIEAIDRQLDTIKELETTSKRGKLRLEDTVVAMSTIYSQTILMDAKEIDSSRYQRLQQEIEDEVLGLDDVLVAMDDLYQS